MPLVARPVLATRLFNLAGDQRPWAAAHALRARARAAHDHPARPAGRSHAVGIAIVSYAGDLCIAVNADRDVVRDVDELIAGIEADVAALDVFQTSV